MKYHVLLILITCVLFGCKKSKDENPPLVSITIPSVGLPTFTYESPLFIEFEATDDVGLGSWIVTVKDEQGIERYSSGTRPISSEKTSITENVGFLLDDVHWPGGDYLITVEVRDASDNRNAAFKTIRYYEPPLERKALLVASTQGNTTTLDSLSTQGNFESVFSYATDASTFLAGSWFQEMVIGGDETAQICFSSFSNFAETNCFIGQNPLSDTYVKSMFFDEQTLTYLVSCADGAVREFQRTGNLIRTIPIAENFIIELVYVASGRIVAEARNEAQNLSVLYSMDRQSGALFESVICPGNVVSLCAYNNEILVAGMENGSPYVFYVDPISLEITDLNWFVFDEPLTKVITLTEGRYALAQSTGVYLHIFNSNQFVDGTVNGIEAIDLAYDGANNQLFALDQNTVYQLNPANMTVMNTWPAPTGAFDVEVLFNK